MTAPWPTITTDLVDDVTGTAHVLSVATPTRYETSTDARFPLILVLDAPWMFGTVADATRIMSMSGEAPEAVVAGLGFAAGRMSEHLRERARWYTPTPWVPPEATGVKGIDADECGRAGDLLTCIERQVLPHLEATYRTDGRWLVGHSFSALFGLRTLLTRPTTFDRYLLASPSIWWDGRAVLDVEAATAETADDLDATVFVSAGELETGESPFDMRPDVEELVRRLRGRAYPSLTLHHHTCAGDHHSSTIGAAVSHGLRALHGAD